MLSAFITQSSSSTTVGFSVFIISFLSQASYPLFDVETCIADLVSIIDLSFPLQIITQFGFPYSTDYSRTYRAIWSVFPPNLLAEGLTLLSGATATPLDPGISWSRRGKCAPNDTECVITIVGSLIQLKSLPSFVVFVCT